MRLVATIACRNNSRRLYGKPLQLLEEKSVLEYIIDRIQEQKLINALVLAISEEAGNETFIDLAKSKNIPYVIGDDRDVLSRLIKACDLVEGDTVFRITSESPFCYWEGLEKAIESHKSNQADYTMISKLPDGSAFELINLSALKQSHDEGDHRHRSELCTLYINENKDKFKLNILEPEANVARPDYRLTIDFPEDLIFCRKIIRHFKGDSEAISLAEMIKFLDTQAELRALVENLTDENYIKPYH